MTPAINFAKLKEESNELDGIKGIFLNYYLPNLFFKIVIKILYSQRSEKSRYGFEKIEENGSKGFGWDIELIKIMELSITSWPWKGTKFEGQKEK